MIFRISEHNPDAMKYETRSVTTPPGGATTVPGEENIWSQIANFTPKKQNKTGPDFSAEGGGGANRWLREQSRYPPF